MDLRKLKTIIELFEKSKINELEMTEEGESIKLVKNSQGSVKTFEVSAPQEHAHVQEQSSAVTTIDISPKDDKNLHSVVSPMVGTFHACPSPDDEPFVKVGDQVNEGDSICIIEAMKLFNIVSATASGTVTSIKVKNEQPVGFGDVLITIKTD